VKPRKRATAHIYVVAVLISSVTFLLMFDLTKIQSMNRYIYGAVYTALLVIVLELLTEASRHFGQSGPEQAGQWTTKPLAAMKTTSISITLVGSLALFFFQYGYVARASSLYLFNLSSLSEKMQSRGTFIDAQWQARYRAAQQSIPAGAIFLSRDIATTAYDFGRNTIYFLSQPGACSPPPGMPYFSDSETVSEYLLSHGVRYVAYSYANDGGQPINNDMYRIRPDAKYFDRIYQRASIALSKVLNELGTKRKRLYDDGTLFVLDLQKPAQTQRAYRTPAYFQAHKILTPVVSKATGFDRNKIWTDGHGVIEDIHYQLSADDRFLVLNTFGYHPWMGDIKKLGLRLSVNGSHLPLEGFYDKSYFFSLASVRAPITSITIDSTTFVPREENVRFGMDDDRKTLGIDVDTIEIKSMPR
jgi:hypothetical protein